MPTTERQLINPAAWDTIRRLVDWLDEANGRTDAEIGLRLLKLVEESGEVAQAWIGVQAQNPRKGASHTLHDVRDELCDVIVTAAVALASLTGDPAVLLDSKLARIAARRLSSELPPDGAPLGAPQTNTTPDGGEPVPEPDGPSDGRTADPHGDGPAAELRAAAQRLLDAAAAAQHDLETGNHWKPYPPATAWRDGFVNGMGGACSELAALFPPRTVRTVIAWMRRAAGRAAEMQRFLGDEFQDGAFDQDVHDALAFARAINQQEQS